IQEIMLVADAAITDYSSWIYDYILTGKPGFIFATDIKSYDQERGFYFPLSSTPFPIAKNNEELENNILQFDEAHYQTEVEAFLKDKGCFENGDAAKRTADLIETIMG
ncbi:MAG: CDP-glycerol glycerophosphotransferase family protein, partial [Clostridia bacterium]|nr:CDP-glycerol glycerophosphotransferase family protein [Clostridia bacterium]